ncbi:MAG: hypothetical protein ACK4N5_16155 [Myxococcales bacterium]
MVRRALPRAAAALLVLLLGCGRAELGAASVRGTLYGVSFDLLAPVTVEGAGPFRVTVLKPDAPVAGERTEVQPGRMIEIAAPLLPASGEEIALGIEEFTAAGAQVSRITPGLADRQGQRSGPDLLFDDGSFIARPLRGTVRLELRGRQPGDGVEGSFRLEFQTGEVLEGTFAAALAN